MKIQCPSCDQRLEIPEELAGQTIECPACNASLVVPSLATPPPSPVQVQQSAPQVAASEKPKSSVLKWAAPVAIIAIVALGVIMFSPKDPNGVSSSEPTPVKNDGESQQSTTAAEVKLIERVAGVKAPDISIHEAAEEGDLEAIKQHLAAGTDVNIKTDRGLTPLHYANNKETIELLLAKGADVNAMDADERSPLHLNVFAGRKEIVELLIGKGADVNAKQEKGMTPLHYAAERGFKETAKLLIAKGADVNAKDFQGNTPLDWGVDITVKDKNFNNQQDWGKVEIIADFFRKHVGKTGEGPLSQLKAAGN